jgi:membrane associated rhomboid family serine protease
MLSPPSLRSVPQYPITASFAAVAIIVTIMSWTGQDISELTLDYRVWDQWQVWRGVTAIFPHGSFFHIAFNLYWLWTFGTLVERVYGHWKCLAIYLLLAAFPMLAEFALLNGGIGLSGLGYGLWGMLMMLERRDPRFADAVDRQTNQTFAIWFVLCVVLTVTNVMLIANIAHGVGAIMGILLGLTISGTRAVRWKSCLGLVAIVSFCLLGSTVFWPTVNLSDYAGEAIEQVGLAAFKNGNNARAIQLLTVSAHRRDATARFWYNLGVVYGQAGQFDKALAAFEHAAKMPDADNETRQAAQSLKDAMFTGQTNQ